ncbi:kelch-like protein 28 [Lingula anatina]|uniref:Kelch-like protein 28 n=1 Tax=Lingula anatina TaxID=7574 RepID=A0A1S3IL44_LINAN|nr:kelch-like protein 28 [Lingula anatina]|eukprot:XP_013398965.1 kelch-like protein 28 [Lingula anatina]
MSDCDVADDNINVTSPLSDASSAVVSSNNTYVDQDRAQSLLRGFSVLYENKQFTDMTLVVEEREFPCHKNVLAVSSPYFMAMFTNDLSENRESKVHLKDMTSQTVSLVLDYIYTGEVVLSEDSVQNLLSAANLFQLISLRGGCADFMIRHVNVSNCIGMYFFAKAHECDDLAKKGKEIINNQFTTLCKEQEFMSLPADKLTEIVSGSQISVAQEEVVYEACLAWVLHDLETRKGDLEAVMKCVRFANISSYYFCDCIDNNGLFTDSPSLMKTLSDVRYYHMLKNRHHEMDLNFMPRSGMPYKRAIVIMANPYSDDPLTKYNSIEALLPTECGDATLLGKLPHSLFMPGCAVTGDNQIYLAGGALRKINYRGSVCTEGVCDSVFMFDYATKTWVSKVAMEMKRYQFALTVLDRFVYAIGGQDYSSLLSSVERYDQHANKWEVVTPLPVPTRCMAATSYKGKLYVFGGEEANGISKAAFRYDPVTEQWIQLPSMHVSRALAGCVVYKEKIYIIGGNSLVSEKWKREFLPEHCVCSVEVFDPVTETWSEGPELPNSLCGAGVVKYDNTILVVGGEDENSWMAGLYLLGRDQEGREVWHEGLELASVMSTFGCVVANIPSDLLK